MRVIGRVVLLHGTAVHCLTLFSHSLWVVYSLDSSPEGRQHSSPGSAHCATDWEWRSSKRYQQRLLQHQQQADQHWQLPHQPHHQQRRQRAQALLLPDLSGCGKGTWLPEADACSPVSHGSSSDCLADLLVPTSQNCGSGGCSGLELNGSAAFGVAVSADSLPWVTQPSGCAAAEPACLPQQQQSGGNLASLAAASQLPQPSCSDAKPSHSPGSIADNTAVDWQQLLESWAVPPSAATLVPPQLEALLAEDDHPGLPPACPPAAPPCAAPLQQPSQPPQQCRQPPRPRQAVAPAQPQSARAFRLQHAAAGADAGPQSSGAAVPAQVSAASRMAMAPQQRPIQGMPAIPALRQPPVLQPVSRKRGRPRVYDTITPVLEAAALDWQPSSGGSGGEDPVPRRRGAKPKYICATQEEAVAKRRDRNRQTALATYYRRKARIAELRSTLADLTSEHAALETLADMAEASADCAGYIRPLLEGGCKPADIVLQLLPDGDSS